jgi:hypothetical protein
MILSSFLIDLLPLSNTNFEKRLNLTVCSQIFLNSVVWSGDAGQKLITAGPKEPNDVQMSSVETRSGEELAFPKRSDGIKVNRMRRKRCFQLS